MILGLDERKNSCSILEQKHFQNFLHTANICPCGPEIMFSSILLKTLKPKWSWLPKVGACQLSWESWAFQAPRCGKQATLLISSSTDMVGVSQHVAPQFIRNISDQPQVWVAKSKLFLHRHFGYFSVLSGLWLWSHGFICVTLQTLGVKAADILPCSCAFPNVIPLVWLD